MPTTLTKDATSIQMRPSRTKQLLRQGKPAYGVLSFLIEPALVEIAGVAGFDFMLIDMEHTARDLQTLENMVRAAEVTNLTPLVRVADNDPKLIGLVLDTGVQGIMIPNLKTADDVRRAQAAIFYPPAGKRSVCSASREARYASRRPKFPEHIAHTNAEMMLIALIESKEGVENIDSILDAGVDVAFIGGGDLSTALGYPYQYDHPVVAGAIDKVFAATARRKDVWSGCTTKGDDERWLRKGGRFLIPWSDSSQVWDAYSGAVQRFRTTAEQVGLPLS